MTFSILGYDAATGEIGSAVASRSLAAGGTVTYSRFGVGIVNTQHSSHLTTGQRVLDLMESGSTPQQALDRVLGNAPDSESRQLIAADTKSAMGGWTGEACDGHKAHRIGDTCVAAGNMLATPQVVDRMVEAFESGSGETLGERLIASLEAGERAGGDRRGRQAASVRVLPRPEQPTAINLDLRVDDHPHPLEELRRLHAIFLREFGA